MRNGKELTKLRRVVEKVVRSSKHASSAYRQYMILYASIYINIYIYIIYIEYIYKYIYISYIYYIYILYILYIYIYMYGQKNKNEFLSINPLYTLT